MPHEDLPASASFAILLGVPSPEEFGSASGDRQLAATRAAGIEMQKMLIRDKALLRQKDDFIREQKVLIEECRHRLLNCLQMIVALLSLQGRKEPNAEIAARLSIAAGRVQAIAGLHHHLHRMEAGPTVEFKSYLDRLCRDHSTMYLSEHPDRFIAVQAIELALPTTIGIPLSLVANELVTNAIKHGNGGITVELAASEKGHLLSVVNDGPNLPECFDPMASRGFGMKLVLSLVEQIGGELRIDRGDRNECMRFSVEFA